MKTNKIYITLIAMIIINFSVYGNNIEKEKELDIKISNSIKILMEIDPIVNSNDIIVSSINGNIALKGMTPSKTQYEQAVSLANAVDGINSVDTSNLRIKKSKNYIKDAYITGKIKGKLIADKVIETHQPNPFYINIETVNGNVYITGIVEDRNQAISAISSVYDIKGVTSVTSYLQMTNDYQSVII